MGDVEGCVCDVGIADSFDEGTLRAGEDEEGVTVVAVIGAIALGGSVDAAGVVVVFVTAVAGAVVAVGGTALSVGTGGDVGGGDAIFVAGVDFDAGLFLKIASLNMRGSEQCQNKRPVTRILNVKRSEALDRWIYFRHKVLFKKWCIALIEGLGEVLLILQRSDVRR